MSNHLFVHRAGFGRREVIVAVAAIGIGAALFVLFISQQRAASRKLMCENRQMEIAKAMVRFDALHSRLPGYRDRAFFDEEADPLASSWVVPLLPYLNVDDGKQTLGPYADSAQATATEIQPSYIADLACPDNRPPDPDTQPDWLGFTANCGMPDAPAGKRPKGEPPDWPANGAFFDAFPKPTVDMSLAFIEEHDGASQTIALSENVECGGWTDTRESLVGILWHPKTGRILAMNERRGEGDGSTKFARPSSYHAGGANIAFASSGTQFFSDRIDLKVWQQLLASDDAEARLPGTEDRVWP